MDWLGNRNLGVKLNLLVLSVLGILLLGVAILLTSNTQNLTREVGGERIAQEANIIQSRLAEVEQELSVDIDFLVSSISFFQAVGSRDREETGDIITRANFSLALDDVTVVDGDGKRLVDTNVDEDNSDEDWLLSLALSGTKASALLVERTSTRIEISIAVAAPVVSVTGNILGATQLSRCIDADFLQELTFGRDNVHLGLIYDNQILVRTPSGSSGRSGARSSNVLGNGVAFDPDMVQRARSGQTVVSDDLIEGDNGIPHTVAYTPALASAENSSAVVMVLVDLEELASFQNSTLVNTIVIFVALTALALALIYLAIHHTTIRPLNNLKATAQTMTGGQYDARVPVSTNDEVGQLATAFNEMANAIQQRETSLKIAREQAERADKVKSMFLASMSHELRTPLNAVINLTKFVGLGMYGEVNDEQVAILKMAETSGKHLLSLINDVLDISKIEAGSFELFVEEGVRIDEILQHAAETGRGLVAEKPVSIGLVVEPDLPALTGDTQRIRQIVLNLVSNACKFTDEGQIILSAYQKNGEIRISISDTGPGVEPEDQEAIFEIFRQARTGLRKGGGTGLGLPISRRLAEAHDGRLWVETVPGEGSTFCVALPIKSTLRPTMSDS
jgi:signal transduction histidine kinase